MFWYAYRWSTLDGWSHQLTCTTRQSTLFASLVNISQFYIVAQTGPVSSTVVGHIKTCIIVGLGWAIPGRPMSDKSALGVLIAVAGITS